MCSFRRDGEFAAVACANNRLQLYGIYTGGFSAGDGVVAVCDIAGRIYYLSAIRPHLQVCWGGEGDGGVRADSDGDDSAVGVAA